MTPAFATYIRPATKRPQLWLLLLGLVLCFAVYAAWVSGLLFAFWVLSDHAIFQIWAYPVLKGTTPAGVLILLLSFFGMALGPMIVVRLLHKRGAKTLFGRAAVVIRDFCIAAAVVGTIYSLTTAAWTLGFDGTPNVDLALWLQLLPLSLLGVLLQTGSEELIFRGYLQQQLAARFTSPLIWMVLPSLIFGAVHYDPETAGDSVWLLMASAAIFGLVAADLTAVTGSIGAAWGFHFANNVVALLILSLPGTLSGLSLFTTPYGADELDGLPLLLLVDMAILGFTWWLIRRAVRR